MIMPHAVPSCERGRVENTSTAFFRSHGYRIPLLAGLAGWQALRYVRIFFIRVSLRPSVFVFGGTRRGDEVSRPNLLAREARSLRLGYTARTYGKAGLWGGVWGVGKQYTNMGERAECSFTKGDHCLSRLSSKVEVMVRWVR